MQLRSALRDNLEGWHGEIHPPWRDVVRTVSLAFDDVDPSLELEPWEPIFPARRGQIFPGAPAGAHMLRAFDGIRPEDVRCVILGQDPYPCPSFSTGRAFEAGNVARWPELDKMFSPSVRAVIQMIVAARTGETRYARNFAQWAETLAAIEGGTVDLDAPDSLADRWVASGALLLNSALTLTRFRREVDPHQARGHLPLWRPLVVRVLGHLAQRGAPVVFIGFGDAAAEALLAAGLSESETDASARVILRPHPAEADEALALENPFTLCNRRLQAMGAAPVDW
jgi:uracil-DNA glycosylase